VIVIPPGSRYEDAERQSVACHVYDQYGYMVVEKEGDLTRRHEETREATYLMTIQSNRPPPPQEYYYKDSDRSFQFLGYVFLKDPTLWWQIADVNPQIWYPLDLTMGSYLHVPT
jgi:hypothetical protein